MNHIALAAGIGFLVAAVAAWRGVWRGWTRTFITAHLPLPITIYPAFGLLMLTLPLHETRPFPGSSLLVGTALIFALLAAILALWNPVWFGPRWFRELKASSAPMEPDLTDPLTRSMFFASQPRRDARAPLKGFRSHPPLRRWRVSLVGDPSWGSLGMRRRIGGHLELHQSGLCFYMNGVEARAQQDLITFGIRREDITNVGVVPRRKGNGRWSREYLYPSLEIRTVGGNVHRFEAFFPRRIAQVISAELQLELEDTRS